jgi:putative peptide zinc metalloprotease protein
VGVSLSAAAVQAFVASLRDLDLVERSTGERRLALYERLRLQRGRRRSKIKSLLFLQKKIYDPDRLFERLLNLFWFLWTPHFVVGSLLLLLGAAVVIGLEWGAFTAGFRAFVVDLSDLDHAGANYLFMLGTWMWMTVIHEACHGITCKRFGGEVHDVGVLLLYLQFPGCYCNVNDAWSFPSRARRVWVTFAGGYSGIVLAALAVFAWWGTSQGSPVHRHAYAVIVIGFFGNVLSNFNPLVRFDGYYMLVDLVEVPNLQVNSFRFVGSWFRRQVLRVPEEAMSVSRRERRVLAIYGVCALAYLTMTMVVFLMFVGELLLRRFGESGWLPLLALAAFVLERPARAVVGGARKIQTTRGPARRPALSVALGTVFVVAVALWPLPSWVAGTGRLEAADPAGVRAASAGRVVGGAAGGDEVAGGDLLLRLENPLRVAEARVGTALARESGSAVALAEAEGRPAEAARLRLEAERRAHAAERLQLAVSALTITAPHAGRTGAPGAERRIGKVLGEGELAGQVFARGLWQVRVRIQERQLVDLETRGVARVQVAGLPGRSFAGRIVTLDAARAANDREESEAARLDPTLRPRAFYIAVIELADPENQLRAGLSARLRLPASSRSLGSHAARWLARFVGERLWL